MNDTTKWVIGTSLSVVMPFSAFGWYLSAELAIMSTMQASTNAKVLSIESVLNEKLMPQVASRNNLDNFYEFRLTKLEAGVAALEARSRVTGDKVTAIVPDTLQQDDYVEYLASNYNVKL